MTGWAAMQPERHQQLSDFVGRAMEQPPEARRSFLAAACGDDPDLYQEAVSWLASSEAASLNPLLQALPAPTDLSMLAALSAPHLPVPGDSLNQYRIEEQIGEGGIGTVFRARDERLGRQVAIKVLSEGLFADGGSRRRFQKEAEALARLVHPNVAVLFEFRTADGFDYLAMEFVAGRSLSAMVGTPQDDASIRDLGGQLVTALAAAHDKGVIHGDLKPSNVRVTSGGTLKLLDFGLARTLSLPLPGGHTPSGMGGPAGTLPYMAPELFRGSRQNPRSDIYAVGVVLYELATGRRPFDDRRDQVEPTSPRHLNPGVSAALEAIILHCLALDPHKRPASAREIAESLRGRSTPDAQTTQAWARRLGLSAAAVSLALAGWWTIPARGTDASETSIAVLPLEDLSGDADHEYLSFGLTDGFIDRLSRLGGFRVVPRRSVQLVVEASLAEIADTLQVRWVLSGVVRSVESQFSVSVELADAVVDATVFSKTYGPSDDVLSLRDDMAREVARVVEAKLGVVPAQWQFTEPPDPEAEKAYIRGRSLWARRDEAALSQSIGYYCEAIFLDEDYAEPFVGLSDSYNVLAARGFGAMSADVAYSRALWAARRATVLDPDGAEAHASLAFLLYFLGWNWDEADAMFRRAIELDREYPTARHWYADYLTAMGDFDDAMDQILVAVDLAPADAIINRDVGWHLFYSGRWGEAKVQLDEVLTRHPGFLPAITLRARALTMLDEHDAAVADFETALSQTDGTNLELLGFLGYAHAVEGERDAALEILATLEDAGTVPYATALVLAGLDLRDEAVDWLERAAGLGPNGQRDPTLVNVGVDPRFEILIGTPGFDDLLDQMSYPPYGARSAFGPDELNQESLATVCSLENDTRF